MVWLWTTVFRRGSKEIPELRFRQPYNARASFGSSRPCRRRTWPCRRRNGSRNRRSISSRRKSSLRELCRSRSTKRRWTALSRPPSFNRASRVHVSSADCNRDGLGEPQARSGRQRGHSGGHEGFDASADDDATACQLARSTATSSALSGLHRPVEFHSAIGW